MKKIILCTSLLLGGAALAQNVNIPDANFKAYLVGNTSINTNMDTEIQVSEAQAFTGDIICDNLSIADLTGIEEFTGITQLRCHNNQLSTLDVSQNTSLEILFCYSNQLTSLDISQNSQLEYFAAGFNQLSSLTIGSNANLLEVNVIDNALTSIDVSQCPNLTELLCYDNNLSALDVSANVNLITLQCQGQQISSLPLTTNTALEVLVCRQNTLTSLDLSNCTALTDLNCQSNSLTSLDLSSNLNLAELRTNLNSLSELDLSANTNLIRVECASNVLTSLNVANGANANIFFFTAQQNPGLTCIQVDDSTYSADNWTAIDPASSFSEDCSGAVGLNEQVIELVSVYPNPCFDRLNIDGSVLSVEVYDLSGKLVQSEQTNSFSVENLKKGMYLIKIETPDGLRRAQFIKQ